ncbi:MAG: prepilin-type N-terminal cleavage/methylation domain-containing protein, partial [Kiritimatiellia bacterium]|nr:prepilin-type N-terminal cleavage/methylation domain-containing protein [Kiritimatiellia bacterium]
MSGSTRGFTLLELLVSLVLMVTAFTLIWGVFSSTLSAWRRGSETVDRLHRGDFVFDRLESSLRSAAWFSSQPARYGFQYESAGGESSPEDVFSWV